MNEDKKWLKSGLRYEGVAQKRRPFNVFNCSLDAPKTVTNRDQVIAQALFDKNFGMLTVILVISGLAPIYSPYLVRNPKM